MDVCARGFALQFYVEGWASTTTGTSCEASGDYEGPCALELFVGGLSSKDKAELESRHLCMQSGAWVLLGTGRMAGAQYAGHVQPEATDCDANYVTTGTQECLREVSVIKVLGAGRRAQRA